MDDLDLKNLKTRPEKPDDFKNTVELFSRAYGKTNRLLPYHLEALELLKRSDRITISTPRCHGRNLEFRVRADMMFGEIAITRRTAIIKNVTIYDNPNLTDKYLEKIRKRMAESVGLNNFHLLGLTATPLRKQNHKQTITLKQFIKRLNNGA